MSGMNTQTYSEWKPPKKERKERKQQLQPIRHMAEVIYLRNAKSDWGNTGEPFTRAQRVARIDPEALSKILAAATQWLDRAIAKGAETEALSARVHRIRKAWHTEPPRQALRTIARHWSEIDDAAALAEARTRLLLRKLPAPPLAELPETVAAELDSLRLEDVSSPLVDIASRSIRALEHAYPALLEAFALEAAPATRGKVEVSWLRDDLVVRCVFGPAELAWPGLRATVYSPDPANPPRLIAKRIYSVFGLVEHFETILS